MWPKLYKVAAAAIVNYFNSHISVAIAYIRIKLGKRLKVTYRKQFLFQESPRWWTSAIENQ